MLDFDKLQKTLNPESDSLRVSRGPDHETEFYTELNFELKGQTVTVPNFHTTSTKADSTRVCTTSTTSESSRRRATNSPS